MSRVREGLIRKLVRELIRQELDEANSTSSVGGSYNTPHAFGGSNKKGKGKGKAGYTGGHDEPTDGTGHFIAKDPKLRKTESVNEGKLNEFMYAKLGSKVEKFVKQYYGKNKFVSLPAWKVTMTYPDQPGRTHDQWVKAKSAKDAIQISKKMWSNQNIKVGKAIFDDEHWLGVQKAQKTGFTEGEIKIKKESVNEAIKPQGYSQLNTMVKHATIYLRDLSKALRKQDDGAVLREVHFLAAQFTTMEKMMKDKKWNAKYNESVNEAKPSPEQAGKLFDKLLKKQTKGNLPSTKDIEIVFSLLRKKYGIKGESVNENSKVYSRDVDNMVDTLSSWEKGEFGYTSGNPYMGKKGKAEPFHDSGAGMHVSGGIVDALKALIKRWKKLDVRPATTIKIFKAYHKLPDSKKKFSNPSFWEKFLEKNGISVVAESINEGGMGILDTDQADVLQAIVMRNKNKNTKAILNVALKSGHFKGVDKKELLGYIDGARQFVKYMKSHPTWESINEGRYHAWRNDDSLSPKQKIGIAMRETRDNLTELERVVRYNVRLKNELKVDSRDYWKTTHKALSKISERLVRLANKVGQLH